MTSNKLQLLQTAEDLKHALDVIRNDGHSESMIAHIHAQLRQIDLCIGDRARTDQYRAAFNELSKVVKGYLRLRSSSKQTDLRRTQRFELISELLTRIVLINARASGDETNQSRAEEFDLDLRKALKASTVGPPLSNVYVLGCFETKKTLVTQQTRAIALSVGILKYWNGTRRPKIGIIGGGVAGVTAMCTLLIGGADVTLFERSGSLMPMQRNCSERYLHPYLYDWPAPDAGRSSSDLPFLNWRADYADKVVKQLDPQIEKILAEHGGRTPKIHSPVDDLEPHPSNRGFVISTDKSNQIHEFDIVIIAIGFGVERNPNLPVRSPGYWDNHPVHRTGLFDIRNPGRLLVSGCGDGALVDVVRGAFDNFEHADIISLVPELEQQHIRDRLLEIESIADGQLLTTDKDSFLLYPAYEELLMGISFSPELRQKLAKEYRVTFNSSRIGKFKLGTSILNRVLVHLLLANQHVEFVRGKLTSLQAKDATATTMKKFEASWKNKERQFDDVIIRYGVNPDDHFKTQFPDIFELGKNNFKTIAGLEMISRLPANLNATLSSLRARWKSDT